MRQHHGGKWTLLGFKFLFPARVIQQLGHAIANLCPISPVSVSEFGRTPVGSIVGQDGQAHHRAIIPVEDAVVIDEHPSRKFDFAFSLHFDVNQQPGLFAILPPNLEKLVGQASPCGRFANYLPQFLVERLVTLRPVKVGVDLWKEKREKGFEEMLQRLFPW